jgi:hypothetical protein
MLGQIFLLVLLSSRVPFGGLSFFDFGQDSPGRLFDGVVWVDQGNELQIPVSVRTGENLFPLVVGQVGVCRENVHVGRKAAQQNGFIYRVHGALL